MATRCSKCSKIRLISKDWVQENNTHYCPECWATEQRERQEAQRKAQEIQSRLEQETARRRNNLRQAQEQIDALRERLMRWAKRAPAEADLLPNAMILLARAATMLLQVVRGVQTPDLSALERLANLLDGDARLLDIGVLLQAGLNLTTAFNFVFKQPYTEAVGTTTAQGMLAEALAVLVRLGDRTALERLATIAGDPEHVAQRVAVDALGRSQNKEAIAPLLDLLRMQPSEKRGGIPAPLACALADLGGPTVVEPVLRAIPRFARWSYEHRRARDYIAERLAAIARQDEQARRTVVEIWQEAKEGTMITDPRRPDPHRATTLVAEQVLMEGDGPEAVRIARRWAGGRYYAQVMRGTQALARIDLPETTEALIEILQTSRDLIVGTHDEANAPDIADWAPNTEQRVLAVQALADRHSDVALAALEEACAVPDAAVAQAAHKALAMETTTATVPA